MGKIINNRFRVCYKLRKRKMMASTGGGGGGYPRVDSGQWSVMDRGSGHCSFIDCAPVEWNFAQTGRKLPRRWARLGHQPPSPVRQLLKRLLTGPFDLAQGRPSRRTACAGLGFLGLPPSEFLLENGFLDAVVHRRDLKAYLSGHWIFCRRQRWREGWPSH